jgi:hypothetical protein
VSGARLAYYAPIKVIVIILIINYLILLIIISCLYLIIIFRHLNFSSSPHVRSIIKNFCFPIPDASAESVGALSAVGIFPIQFAAVVLQGLLELHVNLP